MAFNITKVNLFCAYQRSDFSIYLNSHGFFRPIVAQMINAYQRTSHVYYYSFSLSVFIMSQYSVSVDSTSTVNSEKHNLLMVFRYFNSGINAIVYRAIHFQIYHDNAFVCHTHCVLWPLDRLYLPFKATLYGCLSPWRSQYFHSRASCVKGHGKISEHIFCAAVALYPLASYAKHVEKKHKNGVRFT